MVDMPLNPPPKPGGPSDDSNRPVLPRPVREVVAPLRSFNSAVVADTAPQKEETIEIVPHPTTNRFPWTPIENPHYQVAAPPAVEPPLTPDLLLEPELTPMTQQPPIAPTSQIYSPQPVTQTATPLPPAVVEPTPLPVDAATPSLHQAQSAWEAPAAAQFPAVEAREVTLQLTQPEPAPALPPSQQTSTPVVSAKSDNRPLRVYSESTRAVWHVFRPNKLVKAMLATAVLLVIGGFIVFLAMSGTLSDPNNMPLLDVLLKAE